MATNPSDWTPSQPTTCTTSPGRPLVDIGLGAALSSGEAWLGVPAFLSAIYGFVRAAGCASDKEKRKKWLDKETAPILVQHPFDDEEPSGDEAVDRILADEHRAAGKRSLRQPAPRERVAQAPSCAKQIEAWSAERDLKRNAAIFGRMPKECRWQALAERQAQKRAREQAERAEWEERKLAARSAFALRKRIASELANAEEDDGADTEEALERRAWQAMSARERRAWVEMPPAKRKRMKERVLAQYVATAKARDERAARVALEARAWAILTPEERAAWRNAPADERTRLEQLAIERAQQAATKAASGRRLAELDRRHREAMSDEERRVWDSMTEQQRFVGRLPDLTETAEWKAKQAQREAEDAEWQRLADGAIARQHAEEESRRREVAAETERARVAEAKAAEEKKEEEAARRRAERERELAEKEAEAARRRAEQERELAEKEQARKAREARRQPVARPGERGGHCLAGGECKGDLICDPESNRCAGQDPGAPVRVEPKQPMVGYFIANTKPRARVWIDNRDSKLTTPITPEEKLSLKPGKHTVTFVTAERMFTFEFVIEAGKTKKLIKLLPTGD